jgi:hypothetical protein
MGYELETGKEMRSQLRGPFCAGAAQTNATWDEAHIIQNFYSYAIHAWLHRSLHLGLAPAAQFWKKKIGKRENNFFSLISHFSCYVNKQLTRA